jgi:ureidoglycolate lyase
MREMTPEPLTAAAFAPFGRVIEASDEAVKLEINRGHAVRFDRLAEIDVAEGGGTGIISLFRARPLAPYPVIPAKAGAQPRSEAALVLRNFERHPLGSQAFMPLSGRPYLVAVAPPGDFDPTQIRLFRAEGHQGVHYFKGTWHHFLLVLEADTDFLVVDRAGPGDNCEEAALAPGDEIRVAP